MLLSFKISRSEYIRLLFTQGNNWLGNFYLVLKYLLLALVTFSRATAIRKAAEEPAALLPEDTCSCVSPAPTHRPHHLFRFPTWPVGI